MGDITPTVTGKKIITIDIGTKTSAGFAHEAVALLNAGARVDSYPKLRQDFHAETLVKVITEQRPDAVVINRDGSNFFSGLERQFIAKLADGVQSLNATRGKPRIALIMRGPREISATDALTLQELGITHYPAKAPDEAPATIGQIIADANKKTRVKS